MLISHIFDFLSQRVKLTRTWILKYQLFRFFVLWGTWSCCVSC